MSWLIVVAIVSFLGVVVMLAAKIVRIRSSVGSINYLSHLSHSNFVTEFLVLVKKKLQDFLNKSYIFMRPRVHDLVSLVASKMYKMTSGLAQEFLRFHNFVQGRKELKNIGNTSLFIKNISKHKETKGRKRGFMEATKSQI